MNPPIANALLSKVANELTAIDRELHAMKDFDDPDLERRVTHVRRKTRELVVKAVVLIEMADEFIAKLNTLEKSIAEIERRSAAMTSAQRYWLN